MSANVDVVYLPECEAVEVADDTDHTTTEPAPSQVVQLHRDPSDVRMILSIAMAGILLVLLTLLMATLLAYKVLSSPPVVVVDRTKDGDRVVSMNGEVLAGAVSVSTKDQPGDGDKRSAANLFSTYLYRIDPATRGEDLERALLMMVPTSAIELTKQLRHDLELQNRERWQTVWEPQVISVDPTDPYTVRVVGRQMITRVVNNEVKREARQLAFSLKLIFDSQKRAERNSRTGFLIADLRDFQVINDPPHDVLNPSINSESSVTPVSEGQKAVN